MKLRTVIVPLYNDAYLLPWWITHHYPMFDHGIFLDYSSSDETADICRKMAPDWQLIRSSNTLFEPRALDFEIMAIEERLTGWKIALYASEFLHGVDFDRTEQSLLNKKSIGCYFDYFVMTDPFPDQQPVYDKPLIEQKFHGYHENPDDWKYESHARLYHCNHNGGYLPGRHASFLIPICHARELGSVLWYRFSPWTETHIDHKVDIQTRVPQNDREADYSHYLFPTRDDLLEQHKRALARTIDLRTKLMTYPAVILSAAETACAAVASSALR